MSIHDATIEIKLMGENYCNNHVDWETNCASVVIMRKWIICSQFLNNTTVIFLC